MLAYLHMKQNRFIPKIVAGILAAGGIYSIAEKESDRASQEKREKSKKNSVNEQEMNSELDPLFIKEHPLQAELLAEKIPLEKILTAFNESAELVRSHRYPDQANEETYFAACRDEERWSNIQKSIHFASEKTGIPERILIAMGFIESQFKDSAQRSDTSVYGPYQMTLETAQEAARDAQECFGFPIEVSSVDDLKETKTAIRLAALRLRALKKQYGQLGLALADYAGGRVGLEKKIKEAFPKVDFGQKDWEEMQRHHLAEKQAQKKRDQILRQMKQGRSTDQMRQALRQAIRTFEAAGMAYTKSKKAWREKRNALPVVLKDAGVTILALYEHEKMNSGDVSHSITYPHALEDVAERAIKHEQLAKKQMQQAKL